MTAYRKNTMTTLIPILIATITVIGSIGGAWLSASSSAGKEVSDMRLEQQKTDSKQDNSIDLVKQGLQQSACIQNSNIANIANALRVKVVPDPNCK